MLNIYEQKTFQKFEENDPNFNKIIVHINRVLKITTAQTLAIDSLERKIMNLSKRNQLKDNELVTHNRLKEKKEEQKDNDGAPVNKNLKIGDSTF